MKRNKISEIIGNISEEYVTEAIEYNKKKYTYKKRIVWGAIAACFILIITFGSMLIKDVLPGSESEKIVVHNDEETIIFEKSDSIGITQSDMAFTFKEKFRIINEYYSKGYYIAIEVKGNTGQHWVAVNDIKGNIINMVDPGNDSTNLWLTYNSVNTSQIRYFKAKK